MCGIVTVYSPKKAVSPVIVKRYYLQQRKRGYDGFGFAYLTKAGNLRVKRFEMEANCFFALSKVRSKLVMLHHRFPTSTANNQHQNHPISCKTEKARYCLVHNGVISNAEAIRTEKHANKVFSTQGKGTFDREKFNDSEVLLHEIVDYLENGKPIKAEGSIAFVLIETDLNGKFRCLRYARNEWNPLIHDYYASGHAVISSENADAKPECTVPECKLVTLTFKGNKEQRKEETIVFPSYARKTSTAPVRHGGARTSWNWRNDGYSDFEEPIINGISRTREIDLLRNKHHGSYPYSNPTQSKRAKEKEEITRALIDYKEAMDYGKTVYEDACEVWEELQKPESEYADSNLLTEALKSIDEAITEISRASEKAYKQQTRDGKATTEVLIEMRSKLQGRQIIEIEKVMDAEEEREPLLFETQKPKSILQSIFGK